jgi:hypothetical protein
MVQQLRARRHCEQAPQLDVFKRSMPQLNQGEDRVLEGGEPISPQALKASISQAFRNVSRTGFCMGSGRRVTHQSRGAATRPSCFLVFGGANPAATPRSVAERARAAATGSCVARARAP